jgi:hypothetical protein
VTKLDLLVSRKGLVLGGLSFKQWIAFIKTLAVIPDLYTMIDNYNENHAKESSSGNHNDIKKRQTISPNPNAPDCNVIYR